MGYVELPRLTPEGSEMGKEAFNDGRREIFWMDVEGRPKTASVQMNPDNIFFDFTARSYSHLLRLYLQTCVYLAAVSELDLTQ